MGRTGRTTAIAQAEHARRLLRETEEIEARVAAIGRDLSERQLAWQPPDGGWSVAQVFEHLCVAHDSYATRLEEILARTVTPRAAAGATWRPSLAGGFLARALSPQSTRKLPAPRSYRVGPGVRPGVVAEFLRRERDLAAYMTRAAPLDWRRVRTSSPISPLIPLNLGDCFTILVVHAQRHMGQIERLLGRPDFPAG